VGRKTKWENPTGTKTYYCWRNMKSRCYDKNHVAYSNYGGRGISVCDEWRNNFDAFVKDMGLALPYLTLDRIDTNGNYCKANCKWSTHKEQLNNQRRNHIVEKDGVKKTMTQWAESLGLRPDTLQKRLQRMSPEKALKPGNLYVLQHGTRTGYESYKCRCDECKEANNKRHRDARLKRKLKESL
jgi:hypothetical protein